MPDQLITYFFNQNSVFAVLCIVLAGVIVWMQRASEKKDIKIDALNAQLLLETKAHANDYREMAKNDQEASNNTANTVRILSEKIEAAKRGR